MAGKTLKARHMNIFSNIRDWNRVRQTRNELSRLSAHNLDDLGISRADIPAIAQRAVRG